jgi:hypothetical protein
MAITTAIAIEAVKRFLSEVDRTLQENDEYRITQDYLNSIYNPINLDNEWGFCLISVSALEIAMSKARRELKDIKIKLEDKRVWKTELGEKIEIEKGFKEKYDELRAKIDKELQSSPELHTPALNPKFVKTRNEIVHGGKKPDEDTINMILREVPPAINEIMISVERIKEKRASEELVKRVKEEVEGMIIGGK